MDTNVLVRYLAQEDAVQSPLASTLIEGFTPQEPGFVSLVVLVETAWVLTRCYKIKRMALADTLETLLRARELLVEQTEMALLALNAFRSSQADFSDALIAQAGWLAGCRETLTFDKTASTAEGMHLLGQAS